MKKVKKSMIGLHQSPAFFLLNETGYQKLYDFLLRLSKISLASTKAAKVIRLKIQNLF